MHRGILISAVVLLLAAGVLSYGYFARAVPGGTPDRSDSDGETSVPAASRPEPPPVGQSAAGSPSQDGPGTTVVVGGAPEPVKSPRAPMTMLELPDGTFVPVLNGANGAPPVSTAWYREIPWSPIVERVRGVDGLEWYHHADGSYSTTQMIWRQDLSRFDAITRVGHWLDEAPNVVK